MKKKRTEEEVESYKKLLKEYKNKNTIIKVTSWNGRYYCGYIGNLNPDFFILINDRNKEKSISIRYENILEIRTLGNGNGVGGEDDTGNTRK